MSRPYTHLTKPIKIGKFILKNRMQSSNSLPHFSQGPEKYPADAYIAHFLTRARSGAAFITLAGFDDMIEHPPFPDTLDISHFPELDLRDGQCQNYMVELVEAIHSVGSLASGSLFSANKSFYYENEQGVREVISADYDTEHGDDATHAMNCPVVDDQIPAEDLAKIAKSYAQRTALYKKLGFDAVTLHMSYRAQLPGQFLSPLCNHRTDEFGGDSLENRARFPLMVLEEIKKVCGNDMLVEIQFSAEEPEGGYTLEEGIEFLRMAEPFVDIVQVRSAEGDENHPIPFELNPTPFLELAAQVKQAGLDFLVSNVGGWLDPELADRAIAEGKLDLVAMARAWISNPDYGVLVSQGRRDDIVPCLRCNKCHGRNRKEVLTTVCSVNPRFGFEAVDRYLVTEPDRSKNIAVIGGGPGGMRAALYLTDRGHTVTIYEAESELGGAIRHADYIDFKWTLRDYKNYLIHQVEKKGIRVILNTRATPELIRDQYDAVIVAVGAEPVTPKLPGADGPQVTVATDAIMHSETIGQNVVVIGGGEVGVETGMFLAQQGRKVTVVEMRDTLAVDATIMHYRSMFQAAWERIPNFSYVLNATAKEITPDSVVYLDRDGQEHTLPADSVVLSVGMRAKQEEALSFYDAAPDFYMVGDCKKPGTIQTTNRSVYGTVMSI